MINFWYVATPYGKYPYGTDAAHKLACQCMAKLIKLNVNVFSPIAHTHAIAEHGQLEKVNHELWTRVDKPFVDTAGGLIAVIAESWQQSTGMADEIDAFTKAQKPIVYWDPLDDIPLQEIRVHEYANT